MSGLSGSRVREVPRRATSIGERVKARRLELGLSQRDISSPGISYAYVSRIESGSRNPSVAALRKLAAKLDTTPSWLESGTIEPAEELARLLLEEGLGGRVSTRAVMLARTILGRS